MWVRMKSPRPVYTRIKHKHHKEKKEKKERNSAHSKNINKDIIRTLKKEREK